MLKAAFAAIAIGCASEGGGGDADVLAPSDKTHVDGDTAASGGCTFDVEYELSPKIATVGIVSWSTDFAPERARIEFGLAGEELGFTAPVDLDAPGFRTLLLGMKAERTYAFRVVALSEGRKCTSQQFDLTTGSVPNSVPTIQTQAFEPTRGEPGFVITSAGLGTALRESAPMFIFDSDGDIVWYWEEAPPTTSRASMDWRGENMWMMAVNVARDVGRVSRVSMDGLDFDPGVAGLEAAHHDLTALPGGVVTAIAYNGDCSGVIERRPDGGTKLVVPDLSTLYEPRPNQYGKALECHPNSILYHPGDDTYTLSDRNAHAYVKFTRDGTLLWQLGGADPVGNHFEASWTANHGHQVLENGNFLLFSNGEDTTAKVLEFQLDESTWQATQVWEFENELSSFVLGDVQRLPGGNTLITYSVAGVILEVDPAGNPVKEFTTASLGYAMHRASLYGPPPK